MMRKNIESLGKVLKAMSWASGGVQILGLLAATVIQISGGKVDAATDHSFLIRLISDSIHF